MRSDMHAIDLQLRHGSRNRKQAGADGNESVWWRRYHDLSRVDVGRFPGSPTSTARWRSCSSMGIWSRMFSQKPFHALLLTCYAVAVSLDERMYDHGGYMCWMW